VLCLRPASGRRDQEFRFRFTLIDIALKIEPREILPDDLTGFVALDAFGPGIPTGDHPMRVDGKDGVVLHPIDEQPIFFFLVAERLLRKPAVDAVALDTPTCGGGDQQAQGGPQDQNSSGLAQVSLRVRGA